MAALPPRKTGRLTLDDVAQEVGVSHQTVSRVINDHPRVLPATRARVSAAITRLGYRPNRAARFLANQRSTVIGLVTHHSDAYGAAHALLSIQQEVQRQGYTLMTFGLKTFGMPELRQATEELLENAAAGVIVDIPYEVRQRDVQAALGHVPFVALDVDGRGLFPSFRFDHLHGAREGTRHLVAMGHRQIAGIIGEKPWRAAAKRRQGWLSALEEAGLKPGPSVETAWTAAGGYEAATGLLRGHHRKFTAIFAANDLIALGAMSALQGAGVRVPDEVSVVGFDGMPEAEFFYPSLTTVVNDFDVLARESLRSLLQVIKGAESTGPLQKVSLPKLVLRASSRPMRKG
ncbi:MAG TPA: LacI family DNA-binding transcriptional regulator [Chthoniobacterales bacterium]